MRRLIYLPVSFLLLVSGMLWGQTPSVHLESGGVTITVVCESAGSYRFVGTNNFGAIGSFALFESGSGSPAPGHITDLGNNTAILDPEGLDGGYRVVYSFIVNDVTTSVSSNFVVDLLDNIEIQGLPETVCKNDPPYPLVPVPSLTDPGATYTFSGPGVSGNQSSGYYYNPASSQVSEGWIQISLFYHASNGCQVLNSISIYNAFVPTVLFSTASSCIPASGGLVQFNNLTTGKYAVDSWSWNFGDPDSGPDNVSSEENPDHFYPRPGIWTVSLNAVTLNGCRSSQVKNFSFSDQPVVDFTWLTDCFISGETTAFLDRSVSPYATIDDLLWTFRTSDGGVLGQITSNNPEDTIEFPFLSISTYDVTLDVENDLGCSGSITKAVSLKPIYTVSTDGYLETFDDQPADWLVDSEDGIESWVLDEPDFTGFVPTAGDLAWYTNLPPAVGYLENSWVESPCFDLSALSTPLVQVDIMKSFVPGTDGAVMQYQHQVSQGWNILGVVNGGINWYNSYGIDNRPGGSSIGWGLPEFEPDEAWVRAGYAVDALSDFPYVKFRLAVGTGGSLALGNDGFAFDNFHLADGVNNSVLEYFTNSASMDALASDETVEEFIADYSNQVIDLQYHMDYPGEDPMNLNNPVPPSARAFNYGVPTIPYAVLNGGYESDYRYDFSDPGQEPNGEDLKSSSLDISPFTMNLSTSFLTNSLSGRVSISCKQEDFDSNIQLYVVVIESLVTAYTGGNQTTAFRNVVLDILPDPTGEFLGNEWGLGVSKSLGFSWNYAPYLEDVEDLMLVAFIMDRDHDQILQSASLEYSPGTGNRDRTALENALAIYPNPAHDYAYVNLGGVVEHAGSINIIDLAGRSVLSSEVLPGYSIYKLDISSLSQGVYMVQWIDSGVLKGQGKLVHVN